MDIINEALARGRTALSEHNSKRFLAGFSIPVSLETIASDADSAVTEALKIGFPIVLKASGENLFHKTEVEGIVLNITSEEEIRKESHRLLKVQGSEALLVQEMITGDRELVCGLTRDTQFGPCVMFGLGGIFTEILKDVSFRLAPLEERDALEMMGEIKAHKILDAVRGMEPADRGTLTNMLINVGKIGLENDAVKEIDINPVIISGSRPVAADALVVLQPAT